MTFCQVCSTLSAQSQRTRNFNFFIIFFFCSPRKDTICTSIYLARVSVCVRVFACLEARGRWRFSHLGVKWLVRPSQPVSQLLLLYKFVVVRPAHELLASARGTKGATYTHTHTHKSRKKALFFFPSIKKKKRNKKETVYYIQSHTERARI